MKNGATFFCVQCLDTLANSTRTRSLIKILTLPQFLIKILTLPQIRTGYTKKVATLQNNVFKERIHLVCKLENRRATTNVFADFRAATNQHPLPLRHHRSPPSWRMNKHSHKPQPHQNHSVERE